jgi:hypothetical protein
MGAYGGPLASLIPYTQTIVGIEDVQITMDDGEWIYPNPSSGLIMVKGEGEIWIYDAAGKLIHHSRVNTSEIDLRSQPEGIYFIKMMEGRRRVVAKFILDR